MRAELCIHRMAQPCAGELPVAVDGGDRDADYGGDFGDGEAGEIAEVDDFCFARVIGGELIEGVVDAEQIFFLVRGTAGGGIDL